MVPRHNTTFCGLRTIWLKDTGFDNRFCWYFHPLQTQRDHYYGRSRWLVDAECHTCSAKIKVRC